MKTSSIGKVCIVANTVPPAFGGAGLIAYRYAGRLYKKEKLGFILTRKLSLMNPKWTGECKEKEVPSEKILKTPALYNDKSTIYNLTKCFWTEYIKLPLCVFWLLFRNRRSFEVIHCFGASGSLLSSYAIGVGKILRKKTVIGMTLLGNDDPLSILNKDPYKIKGRLRFWLFSLADRVISISPALTSAYCCSTLDMGKLTEIPNPVDTDQFFPALEEEKNRLREKLGIATDKPVLLFTGGITKRKRVDLLIDIFAEIIKTHQATILLLVGPVSLEPEFVENLRQSIKSLGFLKQVIFTDLVDNVNEYMKASDIFVFPSQREGLPNVLLEAMATGLPVVTANIPGITDAIIKDEHDGIIIKEQNPESFALKIRKLLNEKSFYEYISRNACEKVQKDFSIELIDKKYEEVYCQ